MGGEAQVLSGPHVPLVQSGPDVQGAAVPPGPHAPVVLAGGWTQLFDKQSPSAWHGLPPPLRLHRFSSASQLPEMHSTPEAQLPFPAQYATVWPAPVRHTSPVGHVEAVGLQETGPGGGVGGAQPTNSVTFDLLWIVGRRIHSSPCPVGWEKMEFLPSKSSVSEVLLQAPMTNGPLILIPDCTPLGTFSGMGAPWGVRTT